MEVLFNAKGNFTTYTKIGVFWRMGITDLKNKFLPSRTLLSRYRQRMSRIAQTTSL